MYKCKNQPIKVSQSPYINLTLVDFLKSHWLSSQKMAIAAEAQWVKFLELYQEPQRHYHNFYHMDKLVSFYETEVKDLLQDQGQRDAFLLALWFHDAVYDPKRKDNEELSCNVFKDYATEAGLDPVQVDLVQAIIMSTVKHEVVQDQVLDADQLRVCQVFLDADLSVLGSEPKHYVEYAELIWQEYSFYGWEAYCKGRVQVLTKLLDKDSLYFTQELRHRLEHQARANLKDEIARLERGEQLPSSMSL